jgi:hypothetical protein
LTLCEFVSETAARLTYRDRDGTMPGHVWAGIKNHATPPIRRRRGFWSARCDLAQLAPGFNPVALRSDARGCDGRVRQELAA